MLLFQLVLTTFDLTTFDLIKMLFLYIFITLVGLAQSVFGETCATLLAREAVDVALGNYDYNVNREMGRYESPPDERLREDLLVYSAHMLRSSGWPNTPSTRMYLDKIVGLYSNTVNVRKNPEQGPLLTSTIQGIAKERLIRDLTILISSDVYDSDEKEPCSARWRLPDKQKDERDRIYIEELRKTTDAQLFAEIESILATMEGVDNKNITVKDEVLGPDDDDIVDDDDDTLDLDEDDDIVLCPL